MSEPFEIIAAPVDVYWAPLGEAFPVVDATLPTGNWSLIGTSGNKNISPDGVTVSHPQTIERHFMLGGTLPRKVSRTEENTSISFLLHDLTLEQYRLAINNNAIATTPAASGVAGFKQLSLDRGPDVTILSLILRGVSPYDDSMNMQLEVPACFESAEPEVVFSKGQPAGLSLEFGILEATGGETPRLLAQNAAALP